MPEADAPSRQIQAALEASHPAITRRLESAVSYLWGACLGAIATLKIQFAQTVGDAGLLGSLKMLLNLPPG